MEGGESTAHKVGDTYEPHTKNGRNQVPVAALQGCTCACRQFKLDPLTWGISTVPFPKRKARNSGAEILLRWSETLFLPFVTRSLLIKLGRTSESPGCPEHSAFRGQPPIWLSFSLGLPLGVSYVCCRTFASAFSGKHICIRRHLLTLRNEGWARKWLELRRQDC